MASLDTIDKIAHQVLLHCPLAGKPLATIWAINAFEKLARARDEWSWLCKFGVINLPASYSTGTIDITSADPILVTGAGTVWTSAMVGRQLITQSQAPFDIVEFVDSTHLRIGLPWGEADVSDATYEIVQQYITVPEDFAAWIAVVDPTSPYKIPHNVERRQIDKADPRRTSRGTPSCLAEAGYGPSYAGSVDLIPFQVSGSGTVPTFGGAYSGPSDTIYVVEITLTGVTGTAQFKWRRGNGAYITGVVTDAGGNGLSGNVVVNFASGATYTSGNIFVARARAIPQTGLARYEVWPMVTTQRQLRTYYRTLPPDASVPGFALPRSIRGDVVLKGAMAECRAWAGRGNESNKLYDMRAAAKDAAEFDRGCDLLALRDDDIYTKDVTYYQEMPFGGRPWDASWEQRHA